VGNSQVSNLHVKFVGAPLAIGWDETNIVALSVSLVFDQEFRNVESICKHQQVSRGRLILFSNRKLQFLVVEEVNLGDWDAHSTQDSVKWILKGKVGRPVAFDGAVIGAVEGTGLVVFGVCFLKVNREIHPQIHWLGQICFRDKSL